MQASGPAMHRLAAAAISAEMLSSHRSFGLRGAQAQKWIKLRRRGKHRGLLSPGVNWFVARIHAAAGAVVQLRRREEKLCTAG